MTAALGLALLTPVLGAIAVPLANRFLPDADRRWPVGAGAGGATAVAWAAVLLAGGARLGRFDVGSLVAAACLGAALLAAAVPGLSARGLLALAAVTGGLAAGLGRGHAGDLLVAAAVAVALVALDGAVVPYRPRTRTARRMLALAAPAMAGLALLAAGAERLHEATGALDLGGTAPAGDAAAGLLFAGAAAVALAGAAAVRTSMAVLLPAGLVVGVHLAPAVGAPETAALALGATGAALAAGGSRGRARWLPRWRPHAAAALTAWALASAMAATAAGEVAPAAAPLVGTAAVLSAASGLVVLCAAAVPAAALLANGLRDAGGWWALALGGFAAVTAAAVAAAARPPRRRRTAPLRAAGREDAPVPSPVLMWLPPPRLVSGVAAALAVWLLVLPGGWAWAGPAAFGAWSRTALVGGLAAAGALAAASWAGRLALPVILAPARLPAGGDQRTPGRAGSLVAFATLGAVGLAVARLVLSVLRAS